MFYLKKYPAKKHSIEIPKEELIKFKKFIKKK
jgi:hypothetical protein